MCIFASPAAKMLPGLDNPALSANASGFLCTLWGNAPDAFLLFFPLSGWWGEVDWLVVWMWVVWILIKTSFLLSIQHCNQELVLWLFLTDRMNWNAPAEPQGVLQLSCDHSRTGTMSFILLVAILWCIFPLPFCLEVFLSGWWEESRSRVTP